MQGCGDEPYAVACPKHTRNVIEELDLDVPDYIEEEPKPEGMLPQMLPFSLVVQFVA